jgi:hypothetical protein
VFTTSKRLWIRSKSTRPIQAQQAIIYAIPELMMCNSRITHTIIFVNNQLLVWYIFDSF